MKDCGIVSSHPSQTLLGLRQQTWTDWVISASVMRETLRWSSDLRRPLSSQLMHTVLYCSFFFHSSLFEVRKLDSFPEVGVDDNHQDVTRAHASCIAYTANMQMRSMTVVAISWSLHITLTGIKDDANAGRLLRSCYRCLLLWHSTCFFAISWGLTKHYMDINTMMLLPQSPLCTTIRHKNIRRK